MNGKPWRNKSKTKDKLKVGTKAGKCVSIDQMESQIVGFVAQLKGRLTNKRYGVATVFVDHYSNLSYVHLLSLTTSSETMEAKEAFESYSREMGVIIRHYHVDNGRFSDNDFIAYTKKSGQTISYCGVNAHFQNGRAEKRIRDLQESSRTQL